jgi:cell cycle arrest protein BUB3
MDTEVQKKKYAFKCHRQKHNGQDLVYPVNSIAFHPIYGTFATGGCDAIINIWDGENKKRLTQLRQFPTSIASMSFNHDGSLLAVASSYTFEEGEKDHPEDAIIIREISDAEVKPKPRVAK